MTAIAQRVHGLGQVAGLTQAEVARIVGASTRTVARWAAGTADPQPEAKEKLLRLNYVATELVKVLGLSPQDANVWIFEPNRMLNGQSPAERLQANDFPAVHALIEALADGIVA